MSRLATRYGEAQVTEHPGGPDQLGTALVLHGAGTSTATPLLVGVSDALAASGVRTVRLDQPYTLGARRPPAPALQLDTVVRTLLATIDGPVVILGRSSGARVACRVSVEPVDRMNRSGAPDLRGIVALAFPLRPPERRTANRPGASSSRARQPGVNRAVELAAATVPVLVVQGSRDAFGSARDLSRLGVPGVTVHELVGADHGFGVRRRDGRSEAEVMAEVVGVVIPVVHGWMGQKTGS